METAADPIGMSFDSGHLALDGLRIVASQGYRSSAVLWLNAMLTLDRQDFAGVLGGEFYGLRVRLPFLFLEEERAGGRLRPPTP